MLTRRGNPDRSQFFKTELMVRDYFGSFSTGRPRAAGDPAVAGGLQPQLRQIAAPQPADELAV